MATPKRPPPPVPPDADMRSFEFMPLKVEQLRTSRLMLKSTGDEFKVWTALTCAAWHQVPAGSLPNDDDELANLAGFGRDIDAFRQVGAMKLHGYIECSDGRLYNTKLAEVVTDAVDRKARFKERTKAATEARQRKRAERNEQRNVERNETVTSTKDRKDRKDRKERSNVATTSAPSKDGVSDPDPPHHNPAQEPEPNSEPDPNLPRKDDGAVDLIALYGAHAKPMPDPSMTPEQISERQAELDRQAQRLGVTPQTEPLPPETPPLNIDPAESKENP